jgi:hypothetical protein
MQTDPWNSLEIAKLIGGLLTPVGLACFGIYVHRVTKRFEHLQWRSQKLVEKRLTIYDDLAPHFNDLLCYFTYVGIWRDLDPLEVVKLKRVMDKKIYLGAPIFSTEFFVACMAFQSLCYETYNGWGRDASLRTHSQRRREARAKDWKTEWDEYFSESVADTAEIRAAYKRVMEVFAQDIGVHATFAVPVSGRVPANVR